ncbi:efflux RND transporter periplasmic adaptor subunit [Thalassomonas viridans]|uniref:Efflux RND transporter periplasmic adaptor subunit n=1 Tax=Thalassomonas viridans TaxID=137584 RepID=A0AAE9Z182_9GAMM|nr:efflux RND transporter periplasmic adaptor subunit [Thalassomonas viridans]WDE03338.1 efflux RND transporter periplasmic adaptor subunit [Thalassomonas viridans]
MSVSYRQTLVSISMLLLALSGCSEQENTQPQAETIRPVKIFQVANPAAEAFRNFPAEVEANADSKLAFRVSGQIIKFPIKAGNEVTKGQLLAQLDPKDFKLLLDDRQARYELAHSQFERAKLLLEKKLASQADYDEAKANLSVALSSLNSAKTDLEYTSLRAPFSGSVAKVFVENHENIQAKQTILTLQTRDVVDISMQMPENIASRVKKDVQYQPTVIFDSHPDQEFLITVKEWDTQADPTTLTYKVVFSLPTPKNFNVLPGMTANIRMDLSKVITDSSSSFLLPVSAVFTGKDSPVSNKTRHVWKYDPQTQTVSQANVTVGSIKSEGIEVLTGLEPGDQVVSAGVHFLNEGMKVRPWNREKGL